MKHEEEFFEYLTKRYRSRATGEPLSNRAASNYLSRCRRVEQLLGVELDKTTLASDAAVEKLFERVASRPELKKGSSGNVRYPYSTYHGAVRAYRKFLKLD